MDCVHMASIKPSFFRVKRSFALCVQTARDNKAMLTDQELATRIREAVTTCGASKPAIAKVLGVTVPAIDGWIKTGKIDYRRLPALANVTGVGLAYFFPEAGTAETANLTAPEWRAALMLRTIPESSRAAWFSTGHALGESGREPERQPRRAKTS
jgi:hypothetical protein